MVLIVNSKNKERKAFFFNVCVRMDGKAVFVGLDDNYEEANKVKEGSVITVKHQGKNVYGMLQYPKFYHERTDVKWEEIKI